MFERSIRQLDSEVEGTVTPRNVDSHLTGDMASQGTILVSSTIHSHSFPFNIISRFVGE